VYSLELQRHGLSTAITFVVNKSTIFVPTINAVLEIGDQEKPYRYLPTFTEDGAVEAGASIDEVNAVRTGARIAEEAPDLRNRYALSGLVAHRFGDVTVRVEERLYLDTWAMFASTTDFTLPIDVGDSFRIWPHARFHAQKGVGFWSSTYVVTTTSTAGAVAVSVPELRVGDRELGPMMAGTAGAGFRAGGESVGVTLTIDAIYTRYLDHLFIADKLAGFAALTFDAEVN
jgi:hypothetical protein